MASSEFYFVKFWRTAEFKRPTILVFLKGREQIVDCLVLGS